MGQRIRIRSHTKMSWIRNTGPEKCFLAVADKLPIHLYTEAWICRWYWICPMFRTPIDDKVSFFVCCGGKQGNREPKNLNAAMVAPVGGGPLPGGAAALPLPTSPLPNNQAQALSATYPPGKLVSWLILLCSFAVQNPHGSAYRKTFCLIRLRTGSSWFRIRQNTAVQYLESWILCDDSHQPS
jgi:hypothetical protein